MQIHAKKPNQIAVPTLVGSDEKVKHVIQRVMAKDAPEIVLMFAGRVLANEKTISECNVFPGAVLEVMTRYGGKYKRRHHASDETYELEYQDDTPVHEIEFHADTWIEKHFRGEHKGGCRRNK